MKYTLIVVLFLLAVGVFYLATFRPGLPPGDDFALYLSHAKNIAQGRRYAQTGYIYNPNNPRIGPPEYPPLFPLMLAGVYAVAGMDLWAMKALNTALFLAALYVFYRVFVNELRLPYVLGSMAVLALSPYFWNWKDQLLSDVPFLVFCYLTLWVSTLRSAPEWLRVTATTLSLYLAFATRVAAVVLIPVLIAADLARLRRVSRATLVTVVAGGALMVAHSRVFSGTLAYVDQVNALSPPADAPVKSQPAFVTRALKGVKSYVSGVAGCIRPFVWQIEIDLWRSDLGAPFTIALCLTATLLGIAGFSIRVLRGPDVFDLFVAAYTSMILLWRAADLRLLIPVFPLWVAYGAVALRTLARSGRWRPVGALAIALTVAQTALAYASVYAHQNYGAFPDGISDPEFRTLCDYVRRSTPGNAVLIAAEPRIVALLSERAASAYHQPKDDRELWDYFSRISATHMLLNLDVLSDRVFLAEFAARNGGRLHETFRHGKFVLYDLCAFRSGSSSAQDPKSSPIIPRLGARRTAALFVLPVLPARTRMVSDVRLPGA